MSEASAPILTTDNHGDLDETLIVKGRVFLWRTHPNLYRMVMTLAVAEVLLAANFFWLNPTFQVYHLSNYVWATTFLTLGIAKLFFLNVHRSLTGVRVALAFALAFLLFFAIGTGEPWWDGEGSLQLPIMYLSMAAIQVPLLLEPFIQPWTARR